MTLGFLLIIAMLAALVATLLSGYPVAFGLAGVGLVFGALGSLLGVMDFSFLGLLPNRIFSNVILNDLLFAIPLFVAMGVTLEKSNVAEDLLESMAHLFGRLRGGLGLSVTLVGALLAASTGIVGATVVTIGLLALPTMLKRGYDPAFATGAIAASGTLGQIIPPSIVLILLADVLSNAWQQAQLSAGIFSPMPMTAGELFAGALMPGMTLVGLYIVYQLIVSILKPELCPNNPDEEAVNWVKLIMALMPPMVLIIAVLGSILGGIATPTEAASMGAVGALLIGGTRQLGPLGKAAGLVSAALLGLLLYIGGNEWVRGVDGGALYWLAVLLVLLFTMGFAITLIGLWSRNILKPVLSESIKVTSMVYTILIGAAVFSLTFRGLGGDELVQDMLVSLGGGFWGALLAVMVVMFLLGFFLDFIEITFIVVPVVAPVLLAMDGHLGPIWLGVMMAMNLQTSFLTPPFGFALFYLRGVTPPDIPTSAIYRGVLPYIAIQLAMLSILVLFPDLVTALPAYLSAD